MEPNNYLALGFGKSFENTDVIYWGTNGSEGVQQDMFAYSPDRIVNDAHNSY